MEKTKINLFAHFSNKEEFLYDKESYDCSVLFILVAGSFQYRINSSSPCIAKAENIIYCPPNSTFYRKIIEPVDLYMIKFEGALPQREYTVNSRIRSSLRALGYVGFTRSPEEEPVVSHYCRDIIYTLLNVNETYSPVPILKYVHENLHKPLKNSDLCDILHCSEVSLISQFKSLTGKTPQQYVTEKRIEAAKDALLSTPIAIAQIAGLCGFEDPLYFSKVFKKSTGFSPSEFKNKFKL